MFVHDYDYKGFESVLFCCLWDLSKIIEKLKCFSLAVSLHSLLIGEEECFQRYELPNEARDYIPLLLSRRTRGKIIQRLIIDRGHVSRIQKKVEINVDVDIINQKLMESHCKHLQWFGNDHSIPFR